MSPNTQGIEIHQAHMGESISLSQVSSEAHAFHDNRELAEEQFRKLRKELAELQRRFYAEGKHKLLVVLQAMDAGGKDGTIRKVFEGVNPQGVQVTSFKVPSKEELAHDYLWRIHKAVPKKGMIGVFNRSHYEDVLVVRVHNIVPESIWRPRYQQIVDFEKILIENGTTLLKFYLHISKDEQRQRFQDRIDEPSKNWKFSMEDIEKRKYWDGYMDAYEEMINRTSTSSAPWYIIPADQKWYRNLAISKIIIGTLRELDPQYPSPEGDLSGIEVR
jgi:PPK2 family polyphosphate:nucleotide phosphotransferase